MKEPWEYAELHDRQIAAWESKFPKCYECDEHIVEGEDYIELDYGEVYHTECFIQRFQKKMGDWEHEDF